MLLAPPSPLTGRFILKVSRNVQEATKPLLEKTIIYESAVIEVTQPGLLNVFFFIMDSSKGAFTCTEHVSVFSLVFPPHCPDHGTPTER